MHVDVLLFVAVVDEHVNGDVHDMLLKLVHVIDEFVRMRLLLFNTFVLMLLSTLMFPLYVYVYMDVAMVVVFCTCIPTMIALMIMSACLILLDSDDVDADDIVCYDVDIYVAFMVGCSCFVYDDVKKGTIMHVLALMLYVDIDGFLIVCVFMFCSVA